MKHNKSLKLFVCIVIAELAGLIGSIYTLPAVSKPLSGALSWYATLPKPGLNPPSWVFGPVWTILFLLMGIAVFLVWSKYSAEVSERQKIFIKIALSIFILQLLLNVLWSKLFFGDHNPGLAFVDLVFLWIAILATILSFAKISKAAACLLLPYILWVSFAGYLNYSIWNLSAMPTTSLPSICTQEAKLCPDGSYVGRTGPNCAFAICPGNSVGTDSTTSSWKIFTGQKTGITFKYPEKFMLNASSPEGLKYVRAVDWPPEIEVLSEAFKCNPVGSPTARAGESTDQIIGGHEYCVTKESEGAAGSTYISYAYAFTLASTPLAGKTAILTFSLQFPQCMNYDQPKQGECQAEEGSIDVNSVVGAIVSTFGQVKS